MDIVSPSTKGDIIFSIYEQSAAHIYGQLEFLLPTGKFQMKTYRFPEPLPPEVKKSKLRTGFSI